MEETKPERRKKYESKSVKLGKALAKLGLTANAMTALSILVALIAAYFLYLKELLYALVLFSLSILFDVFDGAIARATGKASKLGTLIDHTTDRVVEFIIIFSLAFSGFLSRPLAMLTYFSMLLPSYIRAKGESLFDVSAMSRGLMERKEKLSTLFLGFLLLVLGIEAPVLDRLSIAAIVIVVGSLITAVQRLAYFRGVRN